MGSSSPASRLTVVAGTARGAFQGRVPERYRENWQLEFDERVSRALSSDALVLDAGSGRNPVVPVPLRPSNCRYVGLDLSDSELRRAPAGSYDEIVVGDLTEFVPGLEGRFDLILCFQVLEHVKPLDEAFANLRRYLRPGGRLIAQLSGSFSLFGLANRVLPQRVTVWMLRTFLGREAGTVFPAYYHRCWYTALERMLTCWSKAEVIPVWKGAGYVQFLKPLWAGYIGYEEWMRLGGHRNLASHYVIEAVR